MLQLFSITLLCGVKKFVGKLGTEQQTNQLRCEVPKRNWELGNKVDNFIPAEVRVFRMLQLESF